MTTIIVKNEANDVEEFTFEVELRTLSLGRRTTNDVCIPDLSVSGTHATISIIDGVATLTDLNSTNGTYVNGQVIQKAEITEKDEIILGKVELQFDSELLTVASPVADTASADEPALDVAEENENIDASAGVSAVVNGASAAHLANGHSHDTYDASSTAEPVSVTSAATAPKDTNTEQPHPLDGLEHVVIPSAASDEVPMHDLDSPSSLSKGAVIEIKNGAKSGQILPIDKPVTTLGRPGIQIAAIMRKPDGYFLMHIESDDNVTLPTLNNDSIGDEPVMLQSGDELNVAGIDVEFMLS